MKTKKAFCSWSGGKDSCLALKRARENGYEITHLVTMFDETGVRSRSHAVSLEIMRAQAASLGATLVTPSASWSDYEKVFVETLHDLKNQGCDYGVFGDIDLQAHRDWEEKVCVRAGITAVLPLWNEKRIDLVDEFLNLDYRAVVVCVNEKFLGAEFCGRAFDRGFINDLPETVDACGENGEFHTFVFDGEFFKQPVRYKIAEIYRHELQFPSGDVSKFAYARLV